MFFNHCVNHQGAAIKVLLLVRFCAWQEPGKAASIPRMCWALGVLTALSLPRVP